MNLMLMQFAFKPTELIAQPLRIKRTYNIFKSNPYSASWTSVLLLWQNQDHLIVILNYLQA